MLCAALLKTKPRYNAPLLLDSRNQRRCILLRIVLSLLVTPAAAAMRVSTGPVAVPLLAAGFGVTAAVGGILLAIAGTLPVSPYITTLSFFIYLVCRAIDGVRRRGTVEA